MKPLPKPVSEADSAPFWLGYLVLLSLFTSICIGVGYLVGLHNDQPKESLNPSYVQARIDPDSLPATGQSATADSLMWMPRREQAYPVTSEEDE